MNHAPVVNLVTANTIITTKVQTAPMALTIIFLRQCWIIFKLRFETLNFFPRFQPTHFALVNNHTGLRNSEAEKYADGVQRNQALCEHPR